MSHVNIKHFPQPLTNQEKQDLAQIITGALQNALGVEGGRSLSPSSR